MQGANTSARERGKVNNYFEAIEVIGKGGMYKERNPPITTQFKTLFPHEELCGLSLLA
jgi:hypothetical protein